MTRPTRRPCLCGCGTLLARPNSLPLCRPASARIWEIRRGWLRVMGFDEWQRASNLLMGNPEAVRAALAES